MNTIDMVTAIRKEVNNMNNKGSTKTAAFEKLAKQYRKSPATIENMYYGRNSYDNPTGKIRRGYTNRTYNRSNVYKVYLTMDKNDLSHLLKHLMDDGSKYNSSSFDFSIE